MRDVDVKQREWWDAGLPFVRATVVSTWGSAPLPPGSVMLIGPGGEVVGGVSGGCVEGAVVDVAREVLASGVPTLERYGVSDADAHAVGLTCGGTIEVYVERVSPADTDVAPVGARDRPGRPRLIVFGATEFAVALTRVGRLLDRRITLCDARATFATPARFVDADEVVVDWPHRYLEAQDEAGLLDRHTAVAVLTHDPKFDVPVVAAALRLLQEGRLGYVGMMGSRRTREDRVARLREVGVDPVALERLRSPIGLDIGAATAEEVAISIAAEMIADGARRDGGRLSVSSLPIHPQR